MPDQSISCVTPRGFFAPHLYAKMKAAGAATQPTSCQMKRPS